MKSLLNLFLFVFLVSATVVGQHKITGKVTDESGEPIPGVNVIEKETTNGTITNIDGVFNLEVSSDQSTLTVSFIGFKQQDIAVAGQSEINITMISDVTDLDEVVVTALGIKREKKALGYAAQDVKSEDLMMTGDGNVTSALSGKIAGIQISESAGGAGANTRIEIRGTSSLTGNDNPLWVVDGVPFDNDESGDDGDIWGGTSRAGGAFDLNPEDIESISVLKGPNAAALYGERGGNGVIMVTTKKGARGKGLGITYSGNVTISEAAYFLDMQDKYGQGTDGVYNKNATSSWGPEMNGQLLESWTGEEIPFSNQEDRVKDFTRTGISQNHNIALSAGNDDGSYRVSIGKNITQGIFDDNEVEKLTFDLKADYDINPWLNIDTKISYFRTEGKERPEVGAYSYMSYFYNMPRNIRSKDLYDNRFKIIEGEHVENLYTTADVGNRNPYFLQDQYTDKDQKDRFFGYVSANVKLTNELTAKFKYGLDTYRFGRTDGYIYSDNTASDTRPNYNTKEKYFKEENYEYLISYNKEVNDFDIGLSLGGSTMNNYWEELSAESGKLASEGDFFLANGTNITGKEDIEEYEIRSIYAFGNIAYKDMIYLDMTFRNDWSSTLTASSGNYDNSYLYPSVGLSAIVTEITDLPSWISFAKVRASWAQLGKSAKTYDTSTDVEISTWNYNLIKAEKPNTIITPNLKPEISTSTEFGIDVRLFNGRIGLDATYYYEETKNQILEAPFDETAGASKLLINAGLILNQGVEALLTTVPVKTSDLEIGLDFNFAANKGTVEKLANGVEYHEFGDFNNRTRVRAYVGEKLGQIYGSKYKVNELGQNIIGDDGLPTRTEYDQLLGDVQPDFTGSVSLHVNYKGLYLSSIFSGQVGGEILSITEASATGAGTSKRTTAMNRIDLYADGVLEDGSSNTTLIGAQEYWGAISSINEEFIYDASFLKLKEIAIGYNVPKSLLNKIPNNPISRAKISLIGRNLFYVYKDTPGTVPDASAFSTSFTAKAFDFAPIPATRSYGVSLNIAF